MHKRLTPSLLWFLIPAIAGVILVAGWPVAPDNDLYFHIKAGEIIWKSKQFLTQDIFTYTQNGMPDESWNGWLSKIIFYFIYTTTGLLGLQLLNTVLLLTTLRLIFNQIAAKTRHLGMAAFVCCIAVCLHNRFQNLRPLLFGELCFVYLAVRYLTNLQPWRPKDLLCIGIVIALWTNLHASVVVILPLMILFALFQPTGICFFAPFIAFAATLLNPKGIGLYTYAQKLSEAGKSMAGEWKAHLPITLTYQGEIPFLHISTDINSLIVIAVGLGIFFMSRQFLSKRYRLYASALCLYAAALAVYSTRHIVYLFLPLVILAPIFYYSATQWRVLKMKYWWSWALISLGVLFHFRFYQSYYVLPSAEKAVDFLEQTRLQGNIFNFHGWGSYLIFRQHPNSRVALDNRSLLHRNFFHRMNRISMEKGEGARAEILKSPPPHTDLYFVSAPKTSLASYIDPATWIVAYENNEVAIAIRRNATDQLEQIYRYYRKHHIPFDFENGFSLHAAYKNSPEWFYRQLEIPKWGLWPAPAIQGLWIKNQVEFLSARGLGFEVPSEESILGKIPLGHFRWQNADAGLPAIEVQVSLLGILSLVLFGIVSMYLLFLTSRILAFRETPT